MHHPGGGLGNGNATAAAAELQHGEQQKSEPPLGLLTHVALRARHSSVFKGMAGPSPPREWARLYNHVGAGGGTDEGKGTTAVLGSLGRVLETKTRDAAEGVRLAEEALEIQQKGRRKLTFSAPPKLFVGGI